MDPQDTLIELCKAQLAQMPAHVSTSFATTPVSGRKIAIAETRSEECPILGRGTDKEA